MGHLIKDESQVTLHNAFSLFVVMSPSLHAMDILNQLDNRFIQYSYLQNFAVYSPYKQTSAHVFVNRVNICHLCALIILRENENNKVQRTRMRYSQFSSVLTYEKHLVICIGSTVTDLQRLCVKFKYSYNLFVSCLFRAKYSRKRVCHAYAVMNLAYSQARLYCRHLRE